MIPEKLWNSDCRYCSFRCKDENTSTGRYDMPCTLDCFGESRTIKIDHDGKWLTELELYEAINKCIHYSPHDLQFGICRTCEHWQPFNDEPELGKDICCTHPEGSLNRVDLFPDARQKGPDISWRFIYNHCDRYEADHYWKNTMIDLALRGHIPQNFNPETFEPTEVIEGESIEWQFVRADMEYKARKEQERKQAEEDAKIKPRKRRVKKDPLEDYECEGQLSIFDMVKQ